MMPIKQRMSISHQKGGRIHGSDRHLRLVNVPIMSAKRNSHASQRIIDRPANPQLPISPAMPSSRSRQKNASDQLVLLKLHPRIAFIGIKILERDAPQTFRPSNLNRRAKTQQRRRRISRKCSPTFRAARSNMAKIAILLDAKSTGLPPSKRLVVPKAASIETNVAANRSHIAKNRRRNSRGSFRQHRIIAAKLLTALDGRERSQRPDHGGIEIFADAAHLGDGADIHHVLRREQPLLHRRN